MSLETDIAWAAGLFDGEGCVFMARQVRKSRPSLSYSLRLSMSMVHKPTIERFASIVGHGKVVVHGRDKARCNARDSWQWSTYNAKALNVLRMLRPHLVTKAAEADIAAQFATVDKTHYPKGGRPDGIGSRLEQIREDLRVAKRYEWKHLDRTIGVTVQ
jgi:hypothetical protein